MTENRTYAPPPDPTPAPPRAQPAPTALLDPTTRQPVWKAALVGLLVVLGTPASAVAGFAAVVVWSGCFLSCSGANHGGGFLLGLLAVALLMAGPGLAALLYRRWAPVGWAVLGILGTVLTVVAMFHG